MATLLTLVKINTVDVTAYVVEYEDEQVFGDEIGTIGLKLIKSVKNVVTLTPMQRVEVWRGTTGTTADEKIFDGKMENYELEGAIIKVRARDKAWDLVKKEVTRTFLNTDAEAGKISEIFKTLVTTYGGLNADSSSIQDSGTSITLQKFVCNHDDVFERCRKLADTLQWQFYYKASTDKIYFEPKGYTNNATALTVGTNVIGVPSWKTDVSELVNDVTVFGSQQVVEEPAQTFNGDGVTTTFTVSYEPEYTVVSVGGAAKIGQIEGSSVVADYYVDKKNKKIRFTTAPVTGTNNVSVIVGHAIPTPVHKVHSVSVATYGTFKKTFNWTDVKNTTDAEARTRQYLTKYALPFTSAILKVTDLSTTAIAVGQKVSVTDSINGVTGTYIVNRYVIKYPATHDEVHVGDKEWRLAEWQADMATRVDKLEKEQFVNQDYILEVRDVGATFGASRKALQIQTQTIGTSFIVGHSANGVLGTNSPQNVLGDQRGSPTTVFTANY